MAYDDDELYQTDPDLYYGNENPQPVAPPQALGPVGRFYIGGMDERSPIRPPGTQSWSSGWSPGATPEGIALLQATIAANQQQIQDERVQKELNTLIEGSKNTDEALKAIAVANQFQSMRQYRNDLASGMDPVTAMMRNPSAVAGGMGRMPVASMLNYNKPTWHPMGDGTIALLDRYGTELDRKGTPRPPGEVQEEMQPDGTIKVITKAPSGRQTETFHTDREASRLASLATDARKKLEAAEVALAKTPGAPTPRITPATSGDIFGITSPKPAVTNWNDMLPALPSWTAARDAVKQAKDNLAEADQAYKNYLISRGAKLPSEPTVAAPAPPAPAPAPAPAPPAKSPAPAKPPAPAKAAAKAATGKRLTVRGKDGARYTIPDTPTQRALAREEGLTDLNGNPL